MSYRDNFKMHFTRQFKLLWEQQFKMSIPELLISLTEKELKGFENPAKSKSLFFTSWDGKLFLKSVNKEGELEFFHSQKDFLFPFKGGLLDYFEYFKKGEKSFLPQLFAFFEFQVYFKLFLKINYKNIL